MLQIINEEKDKKIEEEKDKSEAAAVELKANLDK